MIIKSYEVKKNKSVITKNNLFLLYGENVGLKKDIKNFISNEIKKINKDTEVLTLYESEIASNEDIFFNSVYSSSLFSEKKIIVIHDCTDKIFNKIKDVYQKFSQDVYLIFFSNVLDKKSKLRVFFEKEKAIVCVACYLDSERDLASIAQVELKKNNITLSREIINLLIEKSNSDRNNLRNEIEKIAAYAYKKDKIEIEEVKSLINFSGEHKSDILVNECLSGNILQFKKVMSEMYSAAINEILLLRILGNKIHRLLSIKEQSNNLENIDSLLNTCRPPIFWKEKPTVKKQLLIWNLKDLKKIILDINNTELLCKKNPNISNSIFFRFFLEICKKANNFS